MSDDTRRVEKPSVFSDSVVNLLVDWYQVPAVAAVVLFMLWVRLQSFDRFTRNGQVFFSGNDPWYHFRQVQYTVDNWPATMPFDPWTGFPFGTSVDQFGTLYDQLMATAALVVGLGDPSTHTTALVVAVTPAVFGAAVAVPTYFVGKRLGGRFAGVFSAAVLALLPGLFLRRGLVGTADHNIAEPFFQATAVLALLVAVGVAEREKPIYEQVAAREWASLRRPLGYGALAGVAVGLYLWVWPPGVVLVAIFGAFLVIKMAGDFVRGVSPDHLAFAGVTSMVVAGVLALVSLSEVSFGAAAASLVQPALAFGVAFGAAFMAWLGRQWESQSVDESLYPVAVLGIVLAGLGGIWLVVPGFFSTLAGNLSRLSFLFRTGATTATIAEAQSVFFQANRQGTTWWVIMFTEYGLTFFTALATAIGAVALPHLRSGERNRVLGVAGVVALVALVFLVDVPFEATLVVAALVTALVLTDLRAELALVLVWFAFLTSMGLTQIRFNYYLAVPVAVLNGYLLVQFLDVVDLREVAGRVEEIEAYQVMAVAAAVVVVLAPLIAPIAVSTSNGQLRAQPATTVGASAGPGNGILGWAEPLDWMANNTPTEGTFGGADNEMAYLGTYSNTEDFDYPAGSYGVMSWWDYGHWITVEGERIPNANPFQQQAVDAANYLLAPNESAAEAVAESLSEDDARTRFVMVDYKMIAPGEKFGAPTVFYSEAELNVSAMRSPVFQLSGNRANLRMYLKTQRYYESQMIRLYRYHGSAQQPQPIVVNYDERRAANGQTFKLAPQGNGSQLLRQFETMSEAEAFVRNDTTSQIGGWGPFPPEYVPALQHYRLVKVSDRPAPRQLTTFGRLRNTPTWVKVFERVPGASVQGQGPANETVTASVRMSVPTQNSTFVYTQRAETGPDGRFEMTLPYSSTGYENWGPENGYTNTNVRALAPYEFSTPTETTGRNNLTLVRYNATADVTEAQVIGEDGSPVTVTLERQVNRPGGAPNGTDAGNATSPNGTDAGNATGNDTSNDSSGLLGPALALDPGRPAAMASSTDPVGLPALGEAPAARVRDRG